MNSFMSWVGGKKSLRDAFLARFPPYYERYIEVFGGAGWVLFHKPPDNDFEVYNDFNSNLVNLYRCVRDIIFNILQHSLECRTIEVTACVAVIDIELMIKKAVFNCELSQNILLIGDAVALTLQHILMGQTAVQGGDFLIVWHSLPSFTSLRTMPNRLCYQQGYHKRSDKSSVLRNFLHFLFHEVSELILGGFLCLCIKHIMHIIDRAFDFHIM